MSTFWNESYTNASRYSCSKCVDIQYNSILTVVLTIWTFISITIAIKSQIDNVKRKLLEKYPNIFNFKAKDV